MNRVISQRKLNARRGFLSVLFLFFFSSEPQDQKTGIPVAIRQSSRGARLSRNMHPTYGKAGRAARSRGIHAQYDLLPFTCMWTRLHTPRKSAHAACVSDANGKELTAVTTCTTSIETADVVIAIAADTCEERTFILIESQAPCRNFLTTRISLRALNIVKQNNNF